MWKNVSKKSGCCGASAKSKDNVICYVGADDDIISMKENVMEQRGENLLKDDFSGLNDVYREIADEIGIENAVVIFNLFHGMQISFPNRLFSREFTYKAIIKEYNGKNVLQLAQKYNYSERSIWRILKSSQ